MRNQRPSSAIGSFNQHHYLLTKQRNLDPVVVDVFVGDLFVEFRTDPSMRWPIQGLLSFCFLIIREMLNLVAWKRLAGEKMLSPSLEYYKKAIAGGAPPFLLGVHPCIFASCQDCQPAKPPTPSITTASHHASKINDHDVNHHGSPRSRQDQRPRYQILY